VYDSYPDRDLLPLDPLTDTRSIHALFDAVTKKPIGDTLFQFIVIEIVEGGESTLDGAIRVVRRARDDLKAVLGALIRAQRGEMDDRPAVRQGIPTTELRSLVARLIHGANTGDMLALLRLSDEQVIAKMGSFTVKDASQIDEQGYDVISDHTFINVADLHEAERLCQILNAMLTSATGATRLRHRPSSSSRRKARPWSVPLLRTRSEGYADGWAGPPANPVVSRESTIYGIPSRAVGSCSGTSKESMSITPWPLCQHIWVTGQ
jgi:hypothetical protein